MIFSFLKRNKHKDAKGRGRNGERPEVRVDGPEISSRPKRWGESGNVFFTLFGAVALVGVVGVATSTLMRGPVGTVVKLNQSAKADAQMQIAHKLAMLEASKLANSGDCDSDGYVEPIGPMSTAAAACVGPVPAGGGCLPNEIGSSKNDPWGTNYGYCAWDHGGVTGSTCSGSTYNANYLDPRTGENDSNQVVIAIISAGPDRQFQSSCADNPGYLTRAGDDLVLDITYAGAVQASGGLWSLKSGDPNTAAIDKDIEVAGEARFSSGGQFSGGTFGMQDSRLEFFGNNSLLLLPDEVASAACNLANQGALRRNTLGGTQEAIEVCDFVNGGGNDGDWVSVGGSGSTAGGQGPLGAVQLSDGNGGFAEDSPRLVYSSAGNGELTVPELNATGAVDFDATLNVDGAATVGSLNAGSGLITTTGNLNAGGTTTLAGTTVSTLNATGAVDFDTTLNVDGATTLAGTTVSTLNATGAVDFDTTLNVDGALTVGGDITDSNGAVTFSDGDGVDITAGDLDVTNDIYANSFQGINGGVSPEGLFFDSANGLELRTEGNVALEIDSAGDVGIGIPGGPTARLDVGGEIRLRSVGNVAGANCNSLDGALTYTSGDELLVCSSVTGNWETIGTSGGGGGGAATPWDEFTDYIAYENSTFIVNEGSDISFASPALEGAGTRMIWYPSAGSFRAGAVSGNQWDEAQQGQYSTAFGLDTEASGDNSFAAGDAALATTQGAIALGTDVEARATQSIALGNEAIVAAGATNSMAIGLGDASAGNAPQVRGANSLGIFMGDQDSLVFNSPNTVGIFGGEIIVSDGTQTIPSGSLLVDIEGQIGADQYCSEDGTFCFTPEEVASGQVGAPGNDSEIVFNSNGDLFTDPGFIFLRSVGYLGVGGGIPAANLHVSSATNTTSALVDAADIAGSNVDLQLSAGQIDLITSITRDSTLAEITGGAGDAVSIALNASDQTDQLFLSSTGFVGLGTAVPNAQLELTEQMILGSVNDCTAATQGALRLNAGGDVLEMCDFAGSGGYVAIGGASVSAPGTDRQIIFNSGGSLDATAGFVFNSAGQLGIGTNAPNDELDVVGTAQITGATVLGDTLDVTGATTLNNTLDVVGANATTLGGTLSVTDQVTFSSGVDVAQNAIFSGDVGIGDATPDLTLLLDVEGQIGADMYCDEDGINCFLPEDVANNNVPGADREVLFNSGGVLGSAPEFYFDSGGDLVLGILPKPSFMTDAFSNIYTDGDIMSDSGFITTDDGGLYWGDATTSITANETNDYIDFTTDGTGQLRLTSTGRLGLGTTTPASQVHFYEAGNAPNQLILESNPLYQTTVSLMTNGDGATGLGFAGAKGWNIAARGEDYGTTFPGEALAEEDIRVGYWNGTIWTPIMALEHGGDVGIGTDWGADPATKLDVEGTLKIAYGGEACDASRQGAIHFDSAGEDFYVCQDGLTWQRIITAGGGGGGLPAAGSDGEVQFNSGNELWADANFTYSSVGDLVIGRDFASGSTGNIYAGGYTSGNTPTDNAFAFIEDVGTGMYNPADGELGFSADNVERMRLSSAGYLGIGNTAPISPLSIGAEDSIGGNNIVANFSGANAPALGGEDALVMFSRPSLSGAVLGLDSADETFVIASGETANGIELRTNGNFAAGIKGGPSRLRIENDGLIRFESSGAAILNVGDTGARPIVAENGMIRYNTDTDKFEAYQGGSWEDIITSAVGGGAAAPDRGIQFRSGVGFAASDKLTYTVDGDFIVGSDQLDDTTTGLEDNRMFYDVSKGAFRAGRASNTHWDDANVGDRSIALGDGVIASSQGSLALGNFVLSQADNAIALGYDAMATGDYSMAIGLDNAIGSPSPNVSGQSGMGIFMGNQAGVNFASARTMGLFGGRFILDPNDTATNLYPSTGEELLEMDIEGEIGAIKYCDEDANDCFTAADVALLAGGSVPAPGLNTEVIFNSGGQFYASAGFVFDHTTGFAGIGTSSPAVELEIHEAGAGTPALRLSDSDYTLPDFSASSSLNDVSLSNTFAQLRQRNSGVALQGFTTSGNNTGVPLTLYGTHGGTSPTTAAVEIAGQKWNGVTNRAPLTGNEIILDVAPYQAGTSVFRVQGDGVVRFLSSGAMVMNIGDTSERPQGAENGMIRYNTDTDKFEAYQGGSWEDIITSAVGGGAAAPDRGIQFRSGTNFAADANFTYTSAGQLYVGLDPDVTGPRLTNADIYAVFNRDVFAVSYDNNKSDFELARANGTEAAPGAVVLDDTLGTLRFRGYNAAGAFDIAAAMGAITSGVAGNDVSADIYWTNDGSLSGETMRLTSAGRLGLGTSIPGNILTIAGNNQDVEHYSYNGVNPTYGPDYEFYRDGGAEGASAAVDADYKLGGLRFYGYDGTQYERGAYVSAYVDSGVTVADEDMPVHMSFATRSSTDNDTVERMRLTSDGNLGIGIQYASTRLHVAGTLKIADGGETCSAAADGGMVRWSGTVMQYCDGATWQDFASGATASPAAPSRGIQFNSGGQFFAESGFVYTSAGQLIVDASGGTGNMLLGRAGVYGMTGNDNILFGSGAGASTATGERNVLIGTAAGANQDGDDGVMIGYNAGYNASGWDNIFIGRDAGYSTTNGSENTFIGTYSGYSNTGSYNVFIGYETGFANTSGYNNVFTGSFAGYRNTTGHRNSYYGEVAGDKNTESDHNTAMGFAALRYFNPPTTGDAYNTAFGANALLGADGLSTGVRNTALGGLAGDSIQTGSDNILVGYDVDVPTPWTSNYINIGDVYFGSSDTGFSRVAGTLQVAYGGEACSGNAAMEGAIRYSSATDTFSFCANQGNDWESITLGSGTLDALSDTDLAGVLDGDVLTYNSTSGNWEPATVSTNFLGLTDTPGSYGGQAGRFARVNSGETAIEFTDELIETVTGEPSPTAMVINDLGDVSVGGAAGGQFLSYNSVSGDWVASSIPTGQGGKWEDGATAGEIYYNSGNVGIGNTDPAQLLDVGTDGTMRMWLSTNTNSDADPYNLNMNGAAGIGRRITFNTLEGTNRYVMQFGDGDPDQTFFGLASSADGGSSWDQNLVVRGEGRVGINTASPVVALDVVGGIKFASTSLACNAVGHEGAMQFGSGGSNIFEVCADSGSGWEQLALGGTVAGAFTDLSDTPSAYAGQGGRFARVNSGETALEFTDEIIESVAGDAPVGIALNDLSDVSSAGATGGEILIYNNGTGNWEIGTAGSGGKWDDGLSAGDIFYGSGGVGVGINDPDTLLHVDGTIKIGFGGESCDASREGAIHYDSALDKFYGCQTAGSWTELGAGAGGGGGSGLWEDSGSGYIQYANALGGVKLGTTSGGATPASNFVDLLNDLSNVNTGTPLDNSVLRYDSASGEWVASTTGGGLWTAGAGDIIYYNSGNAAVGIGTDTPVGDLHVYNASNIAAVTVEADETGESSVILMTAGDGQTVLGDAATKGWQIFGAGDSFGIAERQNDLGFAYWNGVGWNDTLWLDATAGRVGIGNVTAPVTELDVGGAIKFASTSLACNDVSHEGAMMFGSGGSNIFEVCADNANGWEQLALGGTVAGAFTDLSDTPSGYGGQAGRFARVNSGETAIEFTDELFESVTGQPVPTAMLLDNLGDVSTAGAADGSVIVYNSASGWVIGAAGEADTLSGLSCSADEVAQWNGAAWVCSSSAGGLWEDSGSGYIQYTSTLGGVKIASVVGAAAPAGAIGAAGGGSDTLASLSCSSGEVAQWNGSTWICSSSAGGNWLLNGSDVYYSSGNVGVGTSTPGSELEVVGTVQADMLLLDAVSGDAPTGISLDGLSDVTTAGAADGSVIVYNSASGWVIGAAGEADTLSGLSCSVNEVAQWNGSAWVCSASAGGLWTDSGSGYIEYSSALGGIQVGAIAGTAAPSGAVSSGGGSDTLSGLSCSADEVAQWNGSAWVCSSSAGGLWTDSGSGYIEYTSALGGMKVASVAGAAQPPSGATGGDDLGDHTAIQDLNMAGSDIVNAVDITYSGALTDTSDRRLKTDIKPLDTQTVVGKLTSLETYSFRMKDNPEAGIEFGVMAQEVKEVFPELVKTANDEMGTMSVNYIGLVAPLIEASKELKAENETLKAELAEMKMAQADILQEVKGLKAHTGYGISKAEIGLWVIAGMFGMGGLFFMVGGIMRNRQRRSN